MKVSPVREPVPIEEVQAAAGRIAGRAIRTPLVRLGIRDAPCEIHLKLECLQPIGSFKIRGAANAMAMAGDRLADGVYTASAGNMAQGVAWNAGVLGVPCTVVVPDTAPQTKLDAIERLGAGVVKLPFDEWWNVIVTHRYEPLAGLYFLHPVSDPAVMAGNGTIGLEILQDLPDVDAVVVPYGGGGLSCGIASAVMALRPGTKVFASEASTAAALAGALDRGRPVDVDFTPSFVDGIGSRRVLDEMWPLASKILAGSLVASLEETASAIRLVAERNRVIAEGAAGTAIATALDGGAGSGKVVCVVSGGNIDRMKLATILGGGVP